MGSADDRSEAQQRTEAVQDFVCAPRPPAEIAVSDWEALRYVLAASRAGSLAGAARALGVDPATVSRRIGALERSLGTKLFLRPQGGRLVPTEAGGALLSAAARAEESIDEVKRSARAATATPSGVVRFTTVDVLATLVVAPRLPLLRARFPDLVIDMVVTPHILDLGRDVDLSLRLARPTEGHAVVRRAGGMSLSVYAAARSAGGPRAAAPLDVIAYGDHFIRHGENAWIEAVPSARVVLHTTSIGAALAAARAGLGAALLPDVAAAPDPALVRLDALPRRTRDLWLVVHPDLAKSPRVQAVSSFLVGAIEDAESAARATAAPG